MDHSKSLSVLLIAFRRVDSIQAILDISLEAGIRRIYVALDLATSREGAREQAQILELLNAYQRRFDLLSVHKQTTNVGCAVSVLTGLDWIFLQEEFACVLEDDCIPSIDFFRYIEDSKQYLDSDDSLMLACGTQFAPDSLTQGVWMKSSYSLTWGWATTREKWNKLRLDFFMLANSNRKMFHKHELKHLFDEDLCYWNSGSRRAHLGFVDVWDTILVRNLQVRKQFALLPATSLITNIGSDAFATHTKVSKWTNLPIGTYKRSHVPPNVDLNIDRWLRNNFFKIRFRHIFSTRVTALKDKFSKPSRPPLLKRWLENQIIDL
jgi:hypothetical protein